jgi:hypothetical protein
MINGRTFRIVTADQLSLGQFARWHEQLVSLAERGPSGDYLLPDFGFKFALRATDLSVPDCDLSWGIEASGRTVQINPAHSAGDANVLSAIGEDREKPGQFAVLRQGRLQANRETVAQISGGEFRYAFQKLPVGAVGSFGAKGREWFLVCDLGSDAAQVARQTADFVERCAKVRAKFGAASE